MYDDYDLDYSFSNDYNLDEDSYYEHYAQSDANLDEDYARDGQDYESLAYRHYAWYNLITSHESIMLAQKRIVQVTLDIMCYDDLDLDDINWRELLQLEPGEDVHCKVQEFDIDW
jgi:hypothetical protein